MTRKVTAAETNSISPTRLLARSLLREAIMMERPVAPSPEDLRGTHRAGGHPVVWSRASILVAIRAFMARVGHAPTRHDWNAPRASQLPSVWVVRRRWPTLAAAVQEAQRTTIP